MIGAAPLQPIPAGIAESRQVGLEPQRANSKQGTLGGEAVAVHSAKNEMHGGWTVRVLILIGLWCLSSSYLCSERYSFSILMSVITHTHTRVFYGEMIAVALRVD